MLLQEGQSSGNFSERGQEEDRNLQIVLQGGQDITAYIYKLLKVTGN